MTKILFEQTFSHILVLINKLMDKETPIIIMRDFNSDLFKKFILEIIDLTKYYYNILLQKIG